jgi:hypothetical protein
LRKHFLMRDAMCATGGVPTTRKQVANPTRVGSGVGGAKRGSAQDVGIRAGCWEFLEELAQMPAGFPLVGLGGSCRVPNYAE